MRAEQTGLPLAETLRRLGSALLEEGESEHATQATDYLHQSLQIQRCLHEGTPHLSVARTLYDLGRASSILKNREQAMQYFHESLELSQRLHPHGDRETFSTLYRLSNELVLSAEFRQARVFIEKALNLAESLWTASIAHTAREHDLSWVALLLPQELIEAGDDWADNFREALRGRDLEFCRVLTARDEPLTVLPSADSADLIDLPLPEDFPLQVWLKAPGSEDRRTLTALLNFAAFWDWCIHIGDRAFQEVAESVDVGYWEESFRELLRGRDLEFCLEQAVQAATSCLQKSLRAVGCLAEDEGKEFRANALYGLGQLHMLVKDFEVAVCYLQEALSMKRSLCPRDRVTASIAKTLCFLGQATFHTGKLDLAMQFLTQSLDAWLSVCAALAISDESPLRRQYEECVGKLRRYVLMREEVHNNPSELEDALALLLNIHCQTRRLLSFQHDPALFAAKETVEFLIDVLPKMFSCNPLSEPTLPFELRLSFWLVAFAMLSRPFQKILTGEDEEGDDEAEDEEDQDGLDMDDWKAGTEAEDLGEEGADADDEEEEDEDGDDEEGADEGNLSSILWCLGALRKVVPGSNGGEIRFQVVIGDGTEVALKSQKLELNIEKKGEMSAYAKMMLNTAGRGELAADIGGYSSLSESEEEGSAASRPSARSAAFRRQRGLENIGEARRLEEGGRHAARNRMYDFADAKDPDRELLGSMVTLRGLVNNRDLNGRRGRVTAKKGEGEGREGDEARFVVELDGECKEQKVVKRRHLQFVDAREAWEHEHAASSSSAKGRGKGAQPPSRSDAAEPKPGIGKETSEAKRKPKAKAQVKAAPKATEPDWKKVFPAEDSIRLRDLLQEEVSMGSGSRISARKLEELLRERHSALLDVAKRYVDAVFRSRSKKQAKLDRHQGLTGRTHWLGRFAVLEKLESDFRFDFQANAFCRGHGDDGADEGVEGEGDDEGDEAEEPEPGSGAEEVEAEIPRCESFTPIPEPPPVSEPGQTEEDVPEEGDAAKAPPELPEEQKSAEPEVFEPAPERAVHRFYGFEAGSIFFIPPCELYFTQDSIKSGFKDNGSFGHSSGYSSSDSPGPARDSVKTSSVREMFDAILERRMLKREVEMMDVVFHEGYYYSICNRRLAVYLLLWLCGRCPRLKVQLVSKTDRKMHWDRRFTTECDGDWILIRQTGEAIGRRFQDTTFKHPELTRALSRAGGQARK
ncbi:unnamed protein product [Symbiodinium sp. CCMP2592]|nr:unnamed protein product [Symbiodinium sp. CCMP2592]